MVKQSHRCLCAGDEKPRGKLFFKKKKTSSCFDIWLFHVKAGEKNHSTNATAVGKSQRVKNAHSHF